MSDKAIMAELGRRLKSKRLDRELKQSDMADDIGCSLPTYGKLEKGQGSLGNFIAAMRVLGKLDELNLIMDDSFISPIKQFQAAPKRKVRIRESSLEQGRPVKTEKKSASAIQGRVIKAHMRSELKGAALSARASVEKIGRKK
tara:strand:- start:8933 stop:9361 length:429 start_codon:yes stop_codon:yes gene_type:complete